MNISSAFILLGVAYGVLYFFDSFFKSCAHYPYIKFLEGTGFKIKFLNIQWNTTAFNRSFLRIGSVRSKVLNGWYNVGLWASLILLPIAICLLFVSIIQHFFKTNNEPKLLTPIVPGINLPASELSYYSLSLLICSLFHELGHAIAAVKEDVHIVNIGVTIFFCLPVAYVNLNAENFKSVEPWKRLKILCAGVWHNLVLAFFCYALLLLLPFLFSSAFSIGKGVTIYQEHKNSPLFGNKGLEMADVVTKINGCKIKNNEGWYKCLTEVQNNQGICVHLDLVRSLDESVSLKHLDNGIVECCDSQRKENICFEYQDNNEVIEFPSHVCLPARKILQSTQAFCASDSTCPNNLHCFKPLLNNSLLFKVEISNKPNMIYIGYISDFFRTVGVSSFIPKYFFSSPVVPEVIKKILEYNVMFSFGLAIVNILPCMFMDGQHIINILVYILLGKTFNNETISLISHMISFIFTILLLLYCGSTLFLFLYN